MPSLPFGHVCLLNYLQLSEVASVISLTATRRAYCVHNCVSSYNGAHNLHSDLYLHPAGALHWIQLPPHLQNMYKHVPRINVCTISLCSHKYGMTK